MIICIEGVDRTGKDLLKQYIVQMTNHKHTVISRGLMSGLVYSKLANRDFDYQLDDWKNVLFVYLTCEQRDLDVRCRISNEPKRDFDKDKQYFDDIVCKLKQHNMNIVEFNSSRETPYGIALQVITIAEDICNNRKEKETL